MPGQTTRIIELDFEGAPPQQGGGAISDHIPAGRYLLKVHDAFAGRSRGSDKPMVTVEFRVADGEYEGKKMIERYVVPETPEDSKVGLQRFHALLICLGFKQQKGKKPINLEKVMGRTTTADVDDEEMEASGGYKARVISRPFRFYTEAELAASEEEEEEGAAEPEPEPAADEDEGDDAKTDASPESKKAADEKEPEDPTKALDDLL